MNNNTSAKTRSAIVSAINNLIESNSKNNPYDKTFIGRITDNTNSSKNLYNVSINGKIYENIKGLPLFNFKNNSMVYCIAPQGNMNLLRIILSLDNNVDLSFKNLNIQKLDISGIDLQNISNYLSISSLNTLNGLKVNDKMVDSIDSMSLTANGYIKYTSGLIIQWGTASIAINKSFPIAFPNNVLGIVVTPIPETSIGTYANLNVYDLTTSGFTPRMGGSTSTDTANARTSFIAIGN